MPKTTIPEQSAVNLAQLQQLLNSIAAVSNYSVVYKNVLNKPVEQWPEHLTIHAHPFCMQIKENDWPACINDCTNTTFTKARQNPKPFLKKCHAGCLELVVPVHDNGRLEGVVFFGPLRFTSEEEPHTSRLNSLYSMVPVITRRTLEGWRTLIEAALSGTTKQQHVPEKNSSVRTVRERIEDMVHYIRFNFNKPLSATEAAKRCYVSYSRFHALFTEVTQIPFGRYLQLQRIEAAKQMLSQSTLTITDIAVECGYKNPHCLFDQFRLHLNMTPRQYRQQFSIADKHRI